MSYLNLSGSSLRYRNLLVVIKQTAFEEYSKLKLAGQAPKALRWPRLEQRYRAHKQCVNNLLGILRTHQVEFNCVNRVELDRQHLAGIDLLIAVGGDGTALSAAHFIDHGTIPLLGINSDPNVSQEDARVVKKQRDERRSYGALCMCTASDMEQGVSDVLYGNAEDLKSFRTRIRCIVKSTFAETRLAPALNDLLISNPSPAAVSRYRMGWMEEIPAENIGTEKSSTNENNNSSTTTTTTITPDTRFGGVPFQIASSLNIWSSGLWICTSTGSTAAMKAAGGKPMNVESSDLQYLIREHMMENAAEDISSDINNKLFGNGEKLHLRWNSHKGRIFVDGSHLSHNLELGDEIMIDNEAPPMQMFLQRRRLSEKK